MARSTTALNRKANRFILLTLILLVAAGLIGLFVGKYPLTLRGILADEGLQRKVFLSLRLTRTTVGMIGGFVLGAGGFVFQTVFRNPLASPDMIGVTSGAGAGAAAGILLFGSAALITASAFVGSLLAILLMLAITAWNRSGGNESVVLAGIAVHAIAQTALMAMKLIADPEKQLASIEYWLMGSLSGVNGYAAIVNLILCAICMAALFLMYRQVEMLSMDQGEARMLGMNVQRIRLIVLLIASLAISAVVSMTGLISFLGLIAPHIARCITRVNRRRTMLLSGLIGAILLCAADILSRSIAQSELPVSLFTSLLGAPFLIRYAIRRRYAR